jgi:hypothetical protein
MRVLIAVFLFASILPAQAQLFGARPGYANATLKQEHERQRQQALQRQAAQAQAPKTPQQPASTGK